MLRSARTVSVAEASSRPFVLIPVAVTPEGATVPAGIPDAVNDVPLARTMDAQWCRRHGLTPTPGSHAVLVRVSGPSAVLVSVGASHADAEAYRRAGAVTAEVAPEDSVGVLLSDAVLGDGRPQAQAFVEGAILASFHPKAALRNLMVDVALCGDPLPKVRSHDQIAAGVRDGALVADAVNWAKQMINTPAGDLPPKEFAKQIDQFLEHDRTVKVDIWNESKIAHERLGGLLGVGAGSDEPVRLVQASYVPKGRGDVQHVVLVGKGVCFDSGGLSIKPADAMMNMKTDMSGAAIVMATIAIASRLQLNVKVTAIAPLTENLTGGAAMKPGDVLRARNGVTMEVLNTDAEGRLILADGLSLAAEMHPDAIIDVATLTGAQKVALGDQVGAFFASTESLASDIATAAERSGEMFWRLPLVEAYESHIVSEVADVKNTGKAGFAGAISAALFLRRFTASLPWVHFDIAGPGRSDGRYGYVTRGGTAFSARTLVEFLRARSH